MCLVVLTSSVTHDDGVFWGDPENLVEFSCMTINYRSHAPPCTTMTRAVLVEYENVLMYFCHPCHGTSRPRGLFLVSLCVGHACMHTVNWSATLKLSSSFFCGARNKRVSLLPSRAPGEAAVVSAS